MEHLSNLTRDEAIELGSKFGALIGLGIEGEEGAEAGAVADAEEAAAEGGVHVFTEQESWDVLEDIPDDSAAALILLKHHWAVPVRDAIMRAGGFRISDGFISPLDLVAIGCLAVLTLMIGLPLTYVYGGVLTFGYLAGIGGLPVVLIYLAVNIAMIRAFRTEFRDEFKSWRHLLIPAAAVLVFLFQLWGILSPVPIRWRTCCPS